MNHRNALLMKMNYSFNIFISIIAILISLSNSIKPKSKLLSLQTVIHSSSNKSSNNHNIKDVTHYFESFHYEFDINDYDDIDHIDINSNIITITTHLNGTLFTLNLNDIFPSDLDSIYLDFDDVKDWNEIYLNQVNNKGIRRRLGIWNKAKHKGRYVADGIGRRFKDAQNNCRHLYGDLASIMSKDEEQKVKDLCAAWNKGNCWIGFKKPWGHWEDGRRPTYLKWKAGEPNNYGGNEGCAEISTGGQWNDIKCSLSRVAICERPRIHVVGHYIAVMRSLNWNAANKRCQKLFSTDLATIENARENIMVRRACSALNPDIDCWIGLKRPFKTWNDGEDAKVTNWAEGEPNNAGGNENCAGILSSQRWNDANCDAAKYFVCNTITQEVRVKKRAEAKRRAQNKEAELEKKRKKMEDQIMNQYMQQNQNQMMQKMMSGQSLYGAGGIGSSQANMAANGRGMPNMQQMYQMGLGQGQQAGMGSIFGKTIPGQTSNGMQGGLDGSGSVGNLQSNQYGSIYGDLGPMGTQDKNGQFIPGKPLQIKLVGGGGNSGGGFGGFSGFRRRLQVINQHINEGNMDDIYGRKCRMINDNGYELCVGRNYVDIKRYIESMEKGMEDEIVRTFEPDETMNGDILKDMNNMNGTDGIDDVFEDYMGYQQWKYNVVMNNNKTANYRKTNGIQEIYDDFIQYFTSKQFVYNDDDEMNQCFNYYNNFNLCLKNMDKDMMITINNDEMNGFKFRNNKHWDEIESINKFNDNTITNKCNHINSGDIKTKICIQETHNKHHDLSLYKAAVHFLAVSGNKDNMQQI